MSKITLTSITSITNQESFIENYNENLDRISDAIDLLLSRQGTSPNTMEASIDMDGNRILNLPEPQSDYEPARLIDVVDGIQGPPGETGPAGSVSDGDKGDITVSASGATWTIDSNVISTFGRTLTDDADAATARTTLELGDSATLDVGSTTSTVAAGDDTRFYQYTINTQNVNYTITVGDVTTPTLLRHTSGTAHAYTVNPVATTAYPLGTQVTIHNSVAANTLTITRGAGVSIYANGSTTSADLTLNAGAVITLIHENTNSWLAIGAGIA